MTEFPELGSRPIPRPQPSPEAIAAAELALARAVGMRLQGQVARLKELLRASEPYVHPVDWTLAHNIQQALADE